MLTWSVYRELITSIGPPKYEHGMSLFIPFLSTFSFFFTVFFSKWHKYYPLHHSYGPYILISIVNSSFLLT